MTVGVMVDLGWPWWVSSTMGVVVAVVSAAAFAITRRGVVRGVSGTLLLQGIAAAVLAPLLMTAPAGGEVAGMESGRSGGRADGSSLPSALADTETMRMGGHKGSSTALCDARRSARSSGRR